MSAILQTIDQPTHTLDINITVWKSYQMQSMLWILVKYQMTEPTGQSLS